MWIDKTYRNAGWNPAINQTFTIKGVTYEILMWGKEKGNYVWHFVDWDKKKEYCLSEQELYEKLQTHGIIT